MPTNNNSENNCWNLRIKFEKDYLNRNHKSSIPKDVNVSMTDKYSINLKTINFVSVKIIIWTKVFNAWF